MFKLKLASKFFGFVRNALSVCISYALNQLVQVLSVHYSNVCVVPSESKQTHSLYYTLLHSVSYYSMNCFLNSAEAFAVPR